MYVEIKRKVLRRAAGWRRVPVCNAIPTHRMRRGCRSMHSPQSWTAARRQSTAGVGLARFPGHVGHVAHWSSRYRLGERVRDRHPDWGLYRERVSLPPASSPLVFPPRADASATRASADSWATPAEPRLNPTHLSLINRWRLIIPLPYASQSLRFRGRSQPVARSSPGTWGGMSFGMSPEDGRYERKNNITWSTPRVAWLLLDLWLVAIDNMCSQDSKAGDK